MSAKPYRRPKKIRTAVRPPKLMDVERLHSFEGEFSEDLLANKLFKDQSLENLHLEYLNLQHSLLIQTRFQEFECDRLLVTDSRFQECDLTLLNCFQAGFTRVEFLNCRLTGLQATEASFLDVRFVDCAVDMSFFRFADFNATSFQGCSLREADFQGSDLRGVRFADCKLEGTQFSSAQLDKVDLRGSNLEGLKVGPSDLQGVIIDSNQLVDHAQDFASLLGLTIQD